MMMNQVHKDKMVNCHFNLEQPRHRSVKTKLNNKKVNKNYLNKKKEKS
jgi:hypothetical protein